MHNYIIYRSSFCVPPPEWWWARDQHTYLCLGLMCILEWGAYHPAMLRGGSLTLRCPIAGCCASFTRVLGRIDPGTTSITSFKVGQAPFLKTNWQQCSDHNSWCHDAGYGFVQKWTIWWFPVNSTFWDQTATVLKTVEISQQSTRWWGRRCSCGDGALHNSRSYEPGHWGNLLPKEIGSTHRKLQLRERSLFIL